MLHRTYRWFPRITTPSHPDLVCSYRSPNFLGRRSRPLFPGFVPHRSSYSFLRRGSIPLRPSPIPARGCWGSYSFWAREHSPATIAHPNTKYPTLDVFQGEGDECWDKGEGAIHCDYRQSQHVGAGTRVRIRSCSSCSHILKTLVPLCLCVKYFPSSNQLQRRRGTYLSSMVHRPRSFFTVHRPRSYLIVHRPWSYIIPHWYNYRLP